MSELNPKQARFVEEYLRDFNGTQAAIRTGYSARSARTQAARLLANDSILAAISERSMSADEVLSRIADIARGDIAEFMEITTNGFNIQLMHRDENDNLVINPKTKLIKRIKQKVTTIMPRNETGDEKEIIETEIELYSALEALTTLGKHHKLFTERTELTGKDGEAIAVETYQAAVKKVYAGVYGAD